MTPAWLRGLPPEEHEPGCMCSDSCLHYALLELHRGPEVAAEHRRMASLGRHLSERAGEGHPLPTTLDCDPKRLVPQLREGEVRK